MMSLSAATMSTAPGLVTERVPLSAMSPEQALALYDKVLGKGLGATLSVAPKKDALLIKDTRERVLRYRQLLLFLDIPGQVERRIYVRPTVNRLPSELVAVVKRVFGERLGRHVGLAPDDRSSQLIVHAKASEYATIDRLLRRLDIRPRDERRIFVLPGRTSIPLPGK